MKAYELLSDEKKMCKGNFAVDTDAINATYTYPGINPITNKCKAVKWDLQGALIYCYGELQSRKLIEIATKKLHKRNERSKTDPLVRSYPNLGIFNDIAPHKEVIDFLKELEEYDAYQKTS